MHLILADCHSQALRALRTTLQGNPDIQVIGEASDADALVSLARVSSTDVILVDRELPGMQIKELIGVLHALEPRPAVILMSSECEYGRMLLKYGADAFLSKGEPDWLIEKLNQYVNRIDKKGVQY